jgi:AraC-like DNA-binding protein
MTVFEHVRDQRLEKGVFLMEVEQLNVGEAAAAVGYSNPSNFSAAFFKKYGCKPIQYLKSKTSMFDFEIQDIFKIIQIQKCTKTSFTFDKGVERRFFIL